MVKGSEGGYTGELMIESKIEYMQLKSIDVNKENEFFFLEKWFINLNNLFC